MSPIITHLLIFVLGFITGVGGNYYAQKFTDRRRSKEISKVINKQFENVKNKMPDLIAEMKTDLQNPDYNLCREFFISPSKSVGFNTR